MKNNIYHGNLRKASVKGIFITIGCVLGLFEPDSAECRQFGTLT